MPIAFNPPASAAHAAATPRTRASRDDDAAPLDAFTALLLAAADVQDDAAAAGEPVDARPRSRDAEAQADPATVAAMPLPPLGAAAAAAAAGANVFIVASEKLGARSAGDADVPGMRLTRGANQRVTTDVRASPVDVRAGVARADAAAAAEAAVPTGPVLGAAVATTAAPGTSTSPKITSASDLAGALAAPHERGTPPHGVRVAAASIADVAADAEAALPRAALELASALAEHAAPLAAAKASEARAPVDTVVPLPGTAHAAAPVAPAPVHVDTVAAPAFTPGWQDETVGKLAHIVLAGHERAELKLNPPDLGPVSIRLEMQHDHAAVTIVAASPDTRSALEQSLPQLRDLLASQGITLAQANVHDGGANARERDAAAFVSADAAARRASEGAEPAAGAILARRIGLVDVFA